ncbi:hypothetical protein BO70DRAFT_63892 [Aspergillus heteromorphus CBS 117.55]|uniref:Uncharacterized protein n=1 Tax=Aspergillus heteromorphus CBS 117.55 TaxID=1448321 RepID=A0A317VWQ6_9EURO|nr:uncharacterized protein BO70DRAFT_63892 [Aspergillus heteromorphus CBS 117.55]PWY77338.1 hypothetical protein BO70DRAFT_63892 [Aspergillus heteromorphus CBS 117.55]
MQIPLSGTEVEPSSDRAQQACSFIPDELMALKAMIECGSETQNTPRLLDYKEEKQDDTGLVPGGFIIWIVWEIVPGIRLGNEIGADEFWNLELDERRVIQRMLPGEYEKMVSTGYFPCFQRARNLVWDSANQRLYFVGFRECHKTEDPDRKWRPSLYAVYKLAKPPPECNWWAPTRDGDMRGWQWLWKLLLNQPFTLEPTSVFPQQCNPSQGWSAYHFDKLFSVLER